MFKLFKKNNEKKISIDNIREQVLIEQDFLAEEVILEILRNKKRGKNLS